jgi:hypothetical protein
MAFTNLQKASFDIQTDSHKFPTLTKFKNTASNTRFSFKNMNYFKLLYGLDIPHKSLNYKNLKIAVIDNISFYLRNIGAHFYLQKLFQDYTKRNCQVIVNNARSVQISQ